jgi:hypothetical protein
VRKLPTNLVCAHLGRVLEIEVNGEVWTWPKRAKVDLLWHEPTRSLLWWDATSKRVSPAQAIDDAAAKYEEFQRKAPRRALGRAYQVAGEWEFNEMGRQCVIYPQTGQIGKTLSLRGSGFLYPGRKAAANHARHRRIKG